jgi:hypothetical protein
MSQKAASSTRARAGTGLEAAVGVLLLCVLAGRGAAEKPVPVRYLRPAGAAFVLESEVTRTTSREGSTTVSRTVRGTETMTLTVRRDSAGRVLRAEIVHERGKERKTASLDLSGRRAKITRDGTTDLFKAPDNPVVTTAPDWSDVFDLARRYDAKRGGKQEVAGLWFHPTRPHLLLTFTVEKVGVDVVTLAGKEQQLDRFQVRLRSGGYRVWARGGQVVRVLPAGAKAVPVVLEGYEEATRGLK